VQWTCIAHGGAIAAQPDVTAKVRTLYDVLSRRTRTLDHLLLLKGKLDMLDAQLTYRKELAAQRPARRGDQQDSGVIYLEGAAGDKWDSDDDDDDLDEDPARPTKRNKAGGKKQRKALEDLVDRDVEASDDDVMLVDAPGEEDEDEEDDSGDEDEDEDEDAPLVNGHTSNGLVDVEAEVASAEDSDPDDDVAGGGGVDVSSDEESDSDSDEEEDEEEEEEDSDLDSFINDGSISVVDDEDDVHVSGDSDVEVVADDAPAPKAAKAAKAAKAYGRPQPRPEPRRAVRTKFTDSPNKGRKG
jgi:U3 small nucleolar RNA-associated protein 5